MTADGRGALKILADESGIAEHTCTLYSGKEPYKRKKTWEIGSNG
jgi:hypothetical protein